MSVFDMGTNHRASGDHYFDDLERSDKSALPERLDQNPLDSDESKREHKRLMEWYYVERQKQAPNRMEMAIDGDFYDNIQWDADDAEVVRGRGQMPLVYNEVAAMVDWLIGTERRTRVDWRVLPRSEDDVVSADVRTKTLKYVSDINRVPFARSRAFSDAVKCGLGWVDDGARDDPTEDVLYSRYEDWRNVIHDSSGYDLDLSDARYLFRWRWVDLDIAEMMFPNRVAQVRRAAQDYYGDVNGDAQGDDWYLGEQVRGGSELAGGAGVVTDARRQRIRLIECQYRKPVISKVVRDGPHKGAFFDQADAVMAQHVADTESTIIDRISMRVHFAVMTETDLLSMAQSGYRHNKFTLTPIWAYRNARTRLPYGAIRRVRDIQQDINKRASKALFLLNTNQVIADVGAVDDVNKAREEVDRPDGWITKNPNKEFQIRRDTDAATGQINMMSLGAQKIQSSVGINNENLGRQTNAASGAAIDSRKMNGSIATTELFDNMRYAVQVQGEKQQSHIEQFYTEEKVIRLTGSKGALEWLRVNQPEKQPDGTTRILNDITANQADFIVSDADYAGTLRQVMFDGISAMANRLPPDAAIRLFVIAMEFSDLPNKDEIADAMRKVIGERDPEKEMTPEEQQQAEQQAQQQQQAVEAQRQESALILQERTAKVAKLQAEAAEIAARSNGDNDVARKTQAMADEQMAMMAEKLREVQSSSAAQIMALRSDRDTKLEIARIEADTRLRVAEIGRSTDKELDGMQDKLNSSKVTQ
jgi:hypothetical protein